MKTNTKITLGLFGFGLTVYGLYIFNHYRALYDSITNAFEKKPSIKLNEISADNIKITIFYKISNPSDLSADVMKQTYKVLINGKEIASVINNDKVHISSATKDANGKLIDGITDFPLIVQFNPKDLIKAGINNYLSILIPSQRKNFTFNIKGSLNLKSGILYKNNVPIEIPFTLADLTS